MELLFLHALPLDGSMWGAQRQIFPGPTHAPTLYGFGDNVEGWAVEALRPVKSDRFIVVGCSVGGSCAVEVALAAPDRVAALVLIGTKVGHRPEPDLFASALNLIRANGLGEAWSAYWAPLFSKSADVNVMAEARSTALRQTPDDIARGVTAFHTRKPRDEYLSRFSFPIVVVTGADDIAPGVKTSSLQADKARFGRLHIIPDCGHYVPLERPQQLNKILREVIETSA